METHFVILCPRCQSPGVEVSEGPDDKATCIACDFVGTTKDVYAHPYKSDAPINDTELLQRMSDSLARDFMATAAPAFGKWLGKWGFAWWEGPARDARDHTFRVQVFAQYAAAAGRGMLLAVFETRRKLEKERIAHERHYPT